MKFTRALFVFLLYLIMIPAICLASDSKRPLPPWAQYTYLNGNTNYVFLDIDRGIYSYLDVASVVIKRYDPPVYEISAIIVSNSPDKPEETLIFSTTTWKYIWSDYASDRVMFYKDDLYHPDWTSIDAPPSTTSATTTTCRPGGEMAWWISYRIDFWGNSY